MRYICIQFLENISKDFRVIEGTRFVSDRQTDSKTTVGKTSVSPGVGGGGGGGGDIIKIWVNLVDYLIIY